MSENEKTVLLEVYRSVGQIESKLDAVCKSMDEGFVAVNKRVDSMEQKMDKKKERFGDKFLFPVAVTLTTGALTGLVALIIRVITYMDTLAKGVTP